jgi:hypothetical protein
LVIWEIDELKKLGSGNKAVLGADVQSKPSEKLDSGEYSIYLL